MELARKHGVPPYVVFNDKVLMVMAREKPTTRAQFSTLYGVGEAKTAQYWLPFTQAIANFLDQEH